jgi:hypothetical protein
MIDFFMIKVIFYIMQNYSMQNGKKNRNNKVGSKRKIYQEDQFYDNQEDFNEEPILMKKKRRKKKLKRIGLGALGVGALAVSGNSLIKKTLQNKSKEFDISQNINQDLSQINRGASSILNIPEPLDMSITPLTEQVKHLEAAQEVKSLGTEQEVKPLTDIPVQSLDVGKSFKKDISVSSNFNLWKNISSEQKERYKSSLKEYRTPNDLIVPLYVQAAFFKKHFVSPGHQQSNSNITQSGITDKTIRSINADTDIDTDKTMQSINTDTDKTMQGINTDTIRSINADNETQSQERTVSMKTEKNKTFSAEEEKENLKNLIIYFSQMNHFISNKKDLYKLGSNVFSISNNHKEKSFMVSFRALYKELDFQNHFNTFVEKLKAIEDEFSKIYFQRYKENLFISNDILDKVKYDTFLNKFLINEEKNFEKLKTEGLSTYKEELNELHNMFKDLNSKIEKHSGQSSSKRK